MMNSETLKIPTINDIADVLENTDISITNKICQEDKDDLKYHFYIDMLFENRQFLMGRWNEYCASLYALQETESDCTKEQEIERITKQYTEAISLSERPEDIEILNRDGIKKYLMNLKTLASSYITQYDRVIASTIIEKLGE